MVEYGNNIGLMPSIKKTAQNIWKAQLKAKKQGVMKCIE
jgi:hypothetical protein